MFCLAGIGGRVSGIMKTTESADKILAIDGCPLNCVKDCLQQAGFKKFDHLQLADLGLEKGHSPITEENINMVVEFGGGIGPGSGPESKRPNLQGMIIKAQRASGYKSGYQAVINCESLKKTVDFVLD